MPPTLLETRVAEASRPELAPGPVFAFALASISLIVPLAVHLFMPAIPAVKAALGLSDSVAQLTFSIALFSMAFATLFYVPFLAGLSNTITFETKALTFRTGFKS